MWCTGLDASTPDIQGLTKKKSGFASRKKNYNSFRAYKKSSRQENLDNYRNRMNLLNVPDICD